jgi:hypothetical protein
MNPLVSLTSMVVFQLISDSVSFDRINIGFSVILIERTATECSDSEIFGHDRIGWPKYKFAQKSKI